MEEAEQIEQTLASLSLHIIPLLMQPGLLLTVGGMPPLLSFVSFYDHTLTSGSVHTLPPISPPWFWDIISLTPSL